MPGKKPGPDIWNYSQAGIQMVAIICIFIYLGYKLDQKVQTNRPWFTLGFSVFGVVVGMIWMIRSFNRLLKNPPKSKDKEQDSSNDKKN